MKRYLFLKLCLTILVFAAASPRTKVSESFSRDARQNYQTFQNNQNVRNNQNNQNEEQPDSSQQGDLKAELKDYQGVMGKPGVDFPILTYIPRTGFTCRGKKSGYYADLDTNCQVFHICEEGRKVSFLCPNGTIFQQSDLICDWWFKVDCATAPTLYDESAEQLYEETIRRKENRRVQEQERRTSKLHRQEQRKTNYRENQVKKDTEQYTSQRYDSGYQSREDKETQVPSETASFVNNRYNNEQQKKYLKTFNDVGGEISTYSTNSYKSTTEKIVSRGSRTYSSQFSKLNFRNQVPDIIKTTTQHTIYSPTVPPFTTTRYTTTTPFSTTRYTTTTPFSTTRYTTTSPFSTTRYSTPTPFTTAEPSTTRKPVTGFYITTEYKSSSTDIPYTSPVPFYTSRIISSTPVPFTTVPTTTPDDSTTIHPLAGSGLVTGNDFSKLLPETTTVEENTAPPSVPTPFKSNKNTYLPRLSTPKPTLPTEYTTTLPAVTENLSNMIKTLEELDNNPAIDLEKQFGTRPGLNIPPSAGPKTLHSLAIYFATALDNLVSSKENETDTTAQPPTTLDDTQVTLLSRMTQDKYNSLFDEKNTTTEKSTDTELDLRSLVEHDAHYNDLDSQQSRGPVSSTPRIRQLAQVFTQALSAYLDDPDTFKKVLQEIRPTEPPFIPDNTEDTESPISTLPVSTTEYKSYTKEEDEVLDFSDADKSSTYRPFNENIRTTASTNFVRSTTETFLNEIPTNLPLESEKNETLTKRIPTPNPLALDLNNGLKLSNTSLQDIEDSTEDTTESDDYFPFNTGDDEEDAKIKATAKPYGEGVKPENSTPISEPSTIWNGINVSLNTTSLPSDSLLPPFKVSLLNKKEYNITDEESLQRAHSQSFVSRNSIDRRGKTFNDFTTTTDYDTTTVTTTNYYPTTTISPESTTLETTTKYPETTTTTRYAETTTDYTTTTDATTTTTYVPPDYSTTEVEQTTLSKSVPNNHWSTSPEVTKLWETTLYVDPLIINRNLDIGTTTDVTPTTYRPDYSTLPYRTTTDDYVDDVDLKFTSTTDEPTSTTEINYYTTYIDLGIHSLLNSTELEIASSQANQIFGNLKTSEQDLLIEKMKEAESNSTVRRLILLLVSTCDASLSNNKTVQETRNSILQALLNVPTEKEELNNRVGKQLHIETTTVLPETTSASFNIEVQNKVNDVKDVNHDTRALELLRSLYSLAAKWGKK